MQYAIIKSISCRKILKIKLILAKVEASLMYKMAGKY